MKKNLKHQDSQASIIKKPPKRYTNFQLLTSLVENSESLYPLSTFQQKVEQERTVNSFIKAFEMGQQSDDDLLL